MNVYCKFIDGTLQIVPDYGTQFDWSGQVKEMWKNTNVLSCLAGLSIMINFVSERC